MLRKTLASVRTFIVSLVLTLSLLPASLAPVAVLAQSAGTYMSGNVSGIWPLSGSPYLVDGDVVVPAGQTLTIEAGVTVQFQSWYRLEVNGTLLAQGTAADPILFTAPSPSPGWLGIRFVNAGSGSLLEYVIVENGKATGAAPDNAGGGIYVENSSPTIRNSTIRNNRASRYGGGLYLSGSNAVLSGNLIIDNVVGYGSASGGAIYLDNSDVELTKNVIRGNTVASSGGFSTANGYGGGIAAYNSAPRLDGNVLAGNEITGTNSHKRGGALYLSNSDAVLVNNTITGNAAGTTAGSQIFLAGGAVFSYGSHPVLVNNILWNDTPDELHGSRTGLVGSFTVAYSDVQGGQAGIGNEGYTTVNWLEGNLDADPLFVDAANGDWTLQAGSPAIDAGTAYFEWNGQVVVDLAPGDYDGAAPDMGALEAAGSNPLPNQPPVAVASADPTGGDAPLAVQFSATGSSDPDGTIASYAWDFGDGTQASVANPAHTYDAVGTYQATLTVTDDHGATASDSVSIAVLSPNQPPVAVASASPASGSAPLAVQFSAGGSSDPDGIIVSYAWDLGDGSTSAEANPAYTYSAAGTYQATLTVTDDAGATASDSLTITVSDGNQNIVHVQKQEVERKKRQGRWFALDKVVVVDQNGNKVPNALVTARFYGPTQGEVSSMTKGDGTVILDSSATTDPQGIWCFEILSIVVDGHLYDAGANVVTTQCEG